MGTGMGSALITGFSPSAASTQLTSGNGSTDTVRGPQAILVQALQEAEALLRSNPNVREEYLAHAYHYLAGMLDFYVARYLKGGDPDRPCFVRDMDSYRSWGLPTPNHHYYSAEIDGTGEYRIACERGDTADYCFEILSGLAGDDGVIGQRIDAIEAANLSIEADGRFAIHIGGEPREQNWLRAGPNARIVFVRQTVDDWITEQPTPMLIERVDTNPDLTPFIPPDMEQVEELYRKAAHGMLDQVRFLNDFAINWMQELALNQLPAPSVGPSDAGYFPGQFNSKCRWEIQQDEALIVSIVEPNCAYQSLDLAHPVWFNSIYPREISSSLSKSQSRVSSDGITRFAISAADPTIPNWLNTGGLLEGFLFIRWQRVEGSPPAQPETKIVKIADLRSEFPDDEPQISMSQRAETSRIRRLAMDKRYF